MRVLVASLLLKVIIASDPCNVFTVDRWLCQDGVSYRCETKPTPNGEVAFTYATYECGKFGLPCDAFTNRCVINSNICLNGATYLANFCDCDKYAYWSGVACEVCNPTTEQVNSCSSKQIDYDTCKCKCYDDCANDGIKYGDCLCQCPYNCVHGKRNKDCSCKCNGYWSGNLCQTCSLIDADCGEGGHVDDNCQCVCGIECQEATTVKQEDNCSCTCLGGWSGKECKQCLVTPDSCTNGTVYNEEKCECECVTPCKEANTIGFDDHCGCNCKDSWGGDFCEACHLNASSCDNGKEVHEGLCSCVCATPCSVHSKGIKQSTCECVCNEGWEGKLCDKEIDQQNELPIYAYALIGIGSFIILLGIVYLICRSRIKKPTYESEWEKYRAKVQRK